jgi:hypothetical protein
VDFDPLGKSFRIRKVRIQDCEVESALFCDGIMTLKAVFGCKWRKRARLFSGTHKQEQRGKQRACGPMDSVAIDHVISSPVMVPFAVEN